MSNTGKDLYEQIAETMRAHELKVVINDQECPGYRIRHDGCTCGWVNRYFQDPDGFIDHTAQAVGDLLIDLAGTGQLLASIDRIART